ncbi:MAG: hypothetical protein RLZZ09_1416 [Pseudomonadota bacterium]|jgi:uncharacterized protein involved in exopolysaccharide biosynthesis
MTRRWNNKPFHLEFAPDLNMLKPRLSQLKESWVLMAAAPLAAGVLAYGCSFLITPTYRSTITFMPPQQQQGAAAALVSSLSGLANLAGGGLPGLKNPNDQWIGLIQSRSVADEVIGKFNLKSRYERELMEDVRRDLAERTIARAGKDGLIWVTVEDTEPTVAAAIANEYAGALGRMTKKIAFSEASQRRIYFEGLLAKSKNDLTEAQKKLQESGVSIESLRTSPDAALGEVARLSTQLSALELKESVQKTYLARDSQEMTVLTAEISAIRARLKAIGQQRKSGDTDNPQYIENYRNFKYQETLFELLAKQYEIARADEAGEGALIQIVDSAIPAERRAWPKRSLLAISGFMAGLFLSFVYVTMLKPARPHGTERLKT